MTVASAPVVVISSDPAAWIAIAAAVIATAGTVLAAVLASRAERSSKQSEIQAQHIRELESRISERKYQIYQPMIEMLADALNTKVTKTALPPDEVLMRIHKFSSWIVIYGSDLAVTAFQHFLQAIYNGVPPEIATRLYAEFVLAARRDIARSDTQIGALEIIGMRIDDLYTNADYYRLMTQPFEEICKRLQWTPPWSLQIGPKSGDQVSVESDTPGANASTVSPSS